MITFLNCLKKANNQEKYEINILPIDYSGDYLKSIPADFKVLKPSLPLKWMGTRINKEFIRRNFSLKCLFGEALWVIRNRLNLFDKELNIVQRLWTSWRILIPLRKKKYDAAISYIDGCSTYYVMEKIKAEKKVLWVHSEYQKQGYYAPFDRPYYEKCDKIITISHHCKECLQAAFPAFANKIEVLENIIVAEDIVQKSNAECGKYKNPRRFKLLSVGRLHIQKGMDIAIKAAAVLKSRGLDFEWIIVGDGDEHLTLAHLIDEYTLRENVFLIGAKENPYVYMKECDLLVQPSRVEGKSIVLDEAKILCKPIVATNYATVGDSIEHGINGLIVDINENALAEGIIQLAQDANLRNTFSENLRRSFKGNEHELQRYIDIML